MALPIAPPPRSTDVAIQAWAGVTVRIAWTLLGLGIKPQREILADARAHVMYHLDPATPVTHAEDMASRLTEEFVARARGKNPAHPWSADWDVPIPHRWRRSFEAHLDEPGRFVFRKHYGDQRSLEWLSQHVASDGRPVDLAVIEGLRQNLRGALRQVVDGLSIDAWAPERVDRLLQRLAAYAPPPCPRALDVSEGCYPEHVGACPRCDRMLRLLQHEEITLDDLQPPSIGARPGQHAKVLAIHLHPDARRHRRRLREALQAATEDGPYGPISISDDLILVDGDFAEQVANALRLCAEVGEPARVHVRGALVEGPGHWTARGVCGPLADQAAREVLFRSWGSIDAIGELPEELPDPPSAAALWALVAVVALAGAPLVPWAFEQYPWQHPGPEVVVDLREPTPRVAPAGAWLTFDVPDLSLVSLIAWKGDKLVTIARGSAPSDKAPFAAGDGTFRAWVEGDGALVAVSDRPIDDLDTLIANAQRSDRPLEALAEALEQRAHVQVRTRGP
jgi:hypothetical protein